MFKNYPWSKTQYYRRLKKSKELGCSIYDIPDTRGKHNNHKTGLGHYRWNAGAIISMDGYRKTRVGIAHPLADSNGYAYEHWVIWCSAGNIPPKPDKLIHHKNGDKTDNRIENLKLMTKAAHNTYHNIEKGRDELGHFIGKKAAGRELDGKTWSQLPEVNHG